MRWQDNRIVYAVLSQSIVLMVMKDMEAASNVINTLKQTDAHLIALATKFGFPPLKRSRPEQRLSAEAELMQSINDLKARNHIFGELQTVDEILDPAEERDMGEFSMFEGTLIKRPLQMKSVMILPSRMVKLMSILIPTMTKTTCQSQFHAAGAWR